MRFRVQAMGTVALGLTVAIAAQPARGFKIIGSGVDSCETWTADRAAHRVDALEDEQWVVGYLSGAGSFSGGQGDPLNGTDAQAVWAWMDNYCRAHPLVRIIDAANAFVDEHPR